VLCHEGEVEDTFYVVTSGRVVISRAIEGDDEEFVLGFLGTGGYFGEMALITQQPRAATVKTIAETQVLEITKDLFDQVFHASPAMARSILETLIRVIRETDQRAIHDLEERNTELAQAYEDLRAAQAELVAKERMERELEIGGEVQRSLLPTQLPQLPTFEFASRFEPARHVGGDFFDVRLLDDGRVALLLADVSDKGVHAALFMAVTRTLFLTEARRLVNPVDVVQAVHAGLLEVSTSEMFVTALYGVLDPNTGEFHYVRAGHDEPLWVRKDGTTEFLGGRGRFLGMWPGLPLEERQITLGSGDCLIIYSDGVTDMTNPDGEPFGRGRVEAFVRSIRAYEAERIARSLFNVVQQHRGHAPAFDDFTLLVVRAR
jgi:serine phosphatase RsbU (regulator of sigma subunit)